MSTYERNSIKKKVFYKLEKFYRMRRLEKKLGIFDEKLADPEKNLKAYMTSWEGVKAPAPEPASNSFMNYGASYGGPSDAYPTGGWSNNAYAYGDGIATGGLGRF